MAKRNSAPTRQTRQTRQRRQQEPPVNQDQFENDPQDSRSEIAIDPSWEGEDCVFKVKKVLSTFEKGAYLLVPQNIGDYEKFPTAIAIGVGEIPDDKVGSYVLATMAPLPKRPGMPTRWSAEIEEFLSQEWLRSHGKFTKYGSYLQTDEGRAEFLESERNRLQAEVLERKALRDLEQLYGLTPE